MAGDFVPTHIHNCRDLATRFEGCISRQFDICKTLESLADRLPTQVNRCEAVSLASRIPRTLQRAHLLEETMIFPVLMITQGEIGVTLNRLRHEHREDEDHAADIYDAIEALAKRRPIISSAEMGYMFRGLFISLRRHLAFDRDYLLPMYRNACRL